MDTVTIPKKDFQQLVERAWRFEYLRQLVNEDIFALPPSRNINEIIQAFKMTKKYNSAFLKSLKEGLKRSSYSF